MSKLFSVNRVVLILHAIFVVATAVVVFVTAIQGSLPTAWGPAIAFGLGIVSAVAGGTVAVTKFLQGSQAVDQQKHEVSLLQLKHAHDQENRASLSTWSTTKPAENLVSSSSGTTGQVTIDPVSPSDSEPVSEDGPDMPLPERLDPEAWLANRQQTPDETEAKDRSEA